MDRIKIEFDAVSENEGFARVCVAAFATRLDPTLEEINDIKTAVSEAVTNSVIHGYNKKGGLITLTAEIEEKTLKVIIEDSGRGIDNVKKPWSLCLQPERTMNVPEWDLHLWMYLWTDWKYGPSRGVGPE